MYYPLYIFVLHDHRLGGRTTWYSDFSTDQLVRPLGSWTSSPTSWLECSAFTSTRCSLHCQIVGRTVHRSRFIVSYAGGLPAKLGTPRCSDSSCKSCQLRLGTLLVAGSCYVSSVCYQVTPCCSDQGANLGQHVWGLDMRMSNDVGKVSDFFFFDPATRFILHLPAGSGTKWAHFTLR